MPANRHTSSTTTTTSGSGTPGGSKVTTSKQVVPVSPHDSEPDVIYTTKHEEWTTSKKIVNHKTKQVETRVQRQIILEDGRVIADSGPQITTRTTEDNKVEETENTQHKTTGDDPPPAGYLTMPGSNRVLSEKTETTQTMTETKEENMQLHDESFHDLSGTEFHQKALMSTDDLPFHMDGEDGRKFPGKMTHFTSKSQKVMDKDEVREVSELKDGQMTTETTHTHHHEEVHDDEVPEDEVDGDVLPEISAETTRKIEYYDDDDDFDSVSQRFRHQVARDAITHGPSATGNTARNDHYPRKVTALNEDEIRNSETTRWLEDHFGSDQSDIVETNRTHAGGNKITIEMSGGRKAPPRDRAVHVTTFQSSSNNTGHHTVVNGHRSSTESSHRTGSQQSPASSPYRWDEPVASPRVSSSGHKRTPSSLLSTPSSTPSKTPTRTFYLGEEGTYRKERPSSTLKAQSSQWKSTPSLLDQTEDIRWNRKHDSAVHHVTHHRSSEGTAKHQGSTAGTRYYEVNSLRHHSSRPPSQDVQTPSQTLPRGTKFSRVNGDRGCGTPPLTTCDKNIQVALSDEEADERDTPSPPPRRFSPRPPRPRPYDSQQESQTLPRQPQKKSTRDKLSASFTNLTSPKKFFFGGGSSRTKAAATTENEGHYTTTLKNGGHSRYQEAEERVLTYDQNGSPVTSNNSVISHSSYRRHDTRSENYRNVADNHKPISPPESRRVHQTHSSRSGRHLVSTPEPSSSRSGSPPYRKSTKIVVVPEIHTTHDSNNNSYSRRLMTSSPPPPPRLVRATPLDRYCSSSSVSPPDSPSVQKPPSRPPPRRSGMFNGTRSKSYTDVRMPGNSIYYSNKQPHTSVRNPPNFTPLSSPSEIKGMPPDRDHTRERKRCYRIKPAKNGGSMVVEVREVDDR